MSLARFDYYQRSKGKSVTLDPSDPTPVIHVHGDALLKDVAEIVQRETTRNPNTIVEFEVR